VDSARMDNWLVGAVAIASTWSVPGSRTYSFTSALVSR
jgi:hypothetical protein